MASKLRLASRKISRLSRFQVQIIHQNLLNLQDFQIFKVSSPNFQIFKILRLSNFQDFKFKLLRFSRFQVQIFMILRFSNSDFRDSKIFRTFKILKISRFRDFHLHFSLRNSQLFKISRFSRSGKFENLAELKSLEISVMNLVQYCLDLRIGFLIQSKVIAFLTMYVFLL